MNRPQMWKYQLYCKITESYACPPSTKASVTTVVDFKYSTGKMYYVYYIDMNLLMPEPEEEGKEGLTDNKNFVKGSFNSYVDTFLNFFDPY